MFERVVKKVLLIILLRKTNRPFLGYDDILSPLPHFKVGYRLEVGQLLLNLAPKALRLQRAALYSELFQARSAGSGIY